MSRQMLIATAGCLALTGIAAAEDDVKIDFPTFTLAGGESITFEFETGDNGKVITGFTFSGFFDDLGNDASWGSDLRMDLTVGDTTLSYGGFDNPANPWDFDGAGSDSDGLYQHFDPGAFGEIEKAPGIVTFTNDWGPSGGHQWSDVTIIILKVPGPGALALLGAFAVIGGSRRRRA